MTAFSNCPHLFKGAIVGVDSFTPLASMVIFRYTPYAAKGPPEETSRLELQAAIGSTTIERREWMNSSDQILGIVENGEFRRLAPPSTPAGPTRLTSISPQAAQPPESAELDLSKYEGSAIMVAGHDQGGWIFSAEVIDQAGPILTAVVQKVFGEASKAY